MMIKAAPLDSRAAFFWGILLVSLAWSAGPIAHGLACIAVPLLFYRRDAYVHASLLALGVASYFLGPQALPLIVPIVLAFAGYREIAVRALLILVMATILDHHFERILGSSWFLFHLGSAGFIIIPSMIVALVFGPTIGWKFVLSLLSFSVLMLFLVSAGSDRWFEPSVVSSEVFRIIVSIIPIFIAANIFSGVDKKEYNSGEAKWVLVGILVGGVAMQLIPVRPITSVTFDESHGEWESVKSSYTPEDYGRGVNYRYSILYEYSKKLVGDASYIEDENEGVPENGVFVLKMPTKRISKIFSGQLEDWVREGGRLLVIADHTDLYDSTQNINEFLKDRFGFYVNSDAVFDFEGMPNHTYIDPVSSIFGNINATGESFHWQTGASLGDAPVNMISLARYGLSYSEPGDYSRPNRFGTFNPDNSIRYANHVAVAAASAGRGAVAVILDSTPWSNFSFFKESYRQIFRGIIHVLERPTAIAVAGWGGVALVGLMVLVLIFRHKFVFGISGLCLGATLAALVQLGHVSWMAPVEGRDYGLRVVVGKSARLEFLKQLISPGERNYSRIVSAMAKYGLDPSASEPSDRKPNLDQAKSWLLIEASFEQLPSYKDVIEHLRESGDLSILFSPNQVSDPSIRAWLRGFGIFISKTKGLAVSEDMRPGFLNRKGPFLIRSTRPQTGAMATSLLKEFQSDLLFQSYTVRPTTFPRKSGLLTIGFSADQFSDDAVGDIWEGVRPSSLGAHREHQLATALKGDEYLSLFPDGLIAPKGKVSGVGLPAFAVVEDGKVVINGNFDDSLVSRSLSPMENPVGYLRGLKNNSITFIENNCPATGAKTECSNRMLGSDLLEWLVAWVSDQEGNIVAIELMHERRFSGLGKTVNVIFGT